MRWSPATAFVFRFAVVYLGLFSLATQIAGSLLLVPGLSFRGFGSWWPMRAVTSWVAAAVLGTGASVDLSGANGETAAFWIQTAWIFVVSLAGAVAWSLAARGKTDYGRSHEWFRFVVRLALAGQMFEYGITKIIPNQFEAPALNVLVTPVGDLSLNTLLWSTIGASPAYQMVTGWAELLAGILLVLPGTVLLGATVAVVDLLHVFVLNMAFDIGLKLTTMHLLLLALILWTPDLPRLGRFLIRGEAVDAPFRPVRSPWLRSRKATITAVVIGAYMVGVQVWANVDFWYAEGGGAPRSALYGIWDVEQLTVDGVGGPAARHDYDRRWKRWIFDDVDTLTIQRTDDSLARFDVEVDGATVELSRPASPGWSAVFRYRGEPSTDPAPDQLGSDPMPDRLRIDGSMDGQAISALLRRRDEDTFRLLNSGFRWIRPNAAPAP